MTPKVDTFEQDIVEEIKKKEASVTAISSASNNVGNEPILPKKKPIFIIIVCILFVLFLTGLGVVGYIYTISKPLPADTSLLQTPPTPAKTSDVLQKISPELNTSIGRSVVKVEQKADGYIITINDYSYVFAYMTRNEDAYIKDIALLFSAEEAPATLASTTPIILPDPVALSSTTLATSTKATTTKSVPTKPTKVSTSTQLVATTSRKEPTVIPEPEITGPHFIDLTLSNQNMRIWKSGNRSVVYAFVGQTTLLIAGTPEGILTLKSGILR